MKTMYRTIPLLILSAALLAACADVLDLSQETGPAGTGTVTIAVSGASAPASAPARTVAPAAAQFTRYTASFAGTGTHADTNLAGGSGSVYLAPGNWTITVTAYTGNSFDEAGRGSAAVTVVSGQTASANIVISPLTDAGKQGSLRYSVTLPAVNSATLSLTNMTTNAAAPGTPITLGNTTLTGVLTNLDAGAYLAAIRLERGGVYAGRTAVVHIYHGLETALEYTFTFEDILTVTGVTVSPATASVFKGGTRTFAARVTGTGNPAQTVDWSVSGNNSAETTISDAGELSVAAGETASTLTVTAASTEDPAKSGAATVTTLEVPVTPALDISTSVLGDQFGAGDLSTGDASSPIHRSGGTVNLQSGGNVTNNGRVFGGATDYGNVSASSVHVTGGAASQPIYGGFVQSSGNVTGNSITFDSGNMDYGLYGGRTPNGTVQDNKVLINGGTIGAEDIVGGQANTSTQITGNEVIISGGSVNGFFIAGGVSNSNANVSGNKVTISGGTIDAKYFAEHQIGAVIAGGSVGGLGSAVNNTVTISGAPVFGTGVTFYGGYDGSGSSSADFFSGNTLQKNSSAAISSAANFEKVNFGYSGDAGIGSLDLTPTGASSSTLVKLDTGAYDVAFGGVLTGAGGIEKLGAGTLTLSGANNYSGDTTVSGGTLAGNTNSLRGNITNNANVEFNQAAAGTYAGAMSGTGSLTKTGTGTLTLDATNTYGGATNINDGILRLMSANAASATSGFSTLTPG
ncbi:MAG: autotransporter-associated beta strand repeat-containing protein, partial [Treponema sp.]|nr:autotransporter-associated beta strand repeat-containing protein [Treponema sp.]